jgi:SAM-dependent methyltransferase
VKPSLVALLACPRCRAELELQVQRQDGAEILEGSLACRGCGATYGIRQGVPRFVDSGVYAASFGYQWGRFRTVQLDSANGTTESEVSLGIATGWTDEDYRGRLVLDAGVGTGRFADIVARKGGQVVGVDLTTAVDVAWLNIGRRDNVHLIQADIFALPFPDATFDLAYSIGVLHHTPDPRAAFARVAATVKKGGGLAVYLYPRYGASHYVSDVIRQVTTRLPLPVMFPLAALAIPFYYVHRLPVIGKAFQYLVPISLHRNWRWRWLETFDWYTPTYQWKLLYPEVLRWFRANGFRDVEVFDEPIRVRGTKTE